MGALKASKVVSLDIVDHHCLMIFRHFALLGRSLSALASSQIIVNPENDDAYSLRGWYDNEGSSMDFSEYSRGDGGSGGGTLHDLLCRCINTKYYSVRRDFFYLLGYVTRRIEKFGFSKKKKKILPDITVKLLIFGVVGNQWENCFES